MVMVNPAFIDDVSLKPSRLCIDLCLKQLCVQNNNWELIGSMTLIKIKYGVIRKKKKTASVLEALLKVL